MQTNTGPPPPFVLGMQKGMPLVMNDSLLLVAGPGIARRVLKMTDPNEENKDTEGQHSDADLKQYKDQDVEQPNDGSCTLECGRARGEVTNGQSEGLSIILLQYVYLLQVCTCLA